MGVGKSEGQDGRRISCVRHPRVRQWSGSTKKGSLQGVCVGRSRLENSEGRGVDSQEEGPVRDHRRIWSGRSKRLSKLKCKRTR